MYRSGIAWWAWVLVGIAGSTVALVIADFAYGFWGQVNATPVTVQNNTASMVRISSCNDDPLDLSPGAAGEVDIADTSVACTVFNIDSDYAYEGCLYVARSAPGAAVRLDADLRPGVSRGRCENG